MLDAGNCSRKAPTPVGVKPQRSERGEGCLIVVVSLGSGGISEPVSWIIENLSFFVATLADLA